MPGLAGAFDRIGAFLEHRLPLMHAAGVALAVTDREEILGVVVRGLADAGSGTRVRPETRFQIGSISKSFAAIVAVQEAEAGRLDLWAPVTGIVPWVEIPQPFGPITMHHLLSHTSGLATGLEDVLEGTGAVWNLRRLAPGFPPGERFWYSNDGYKVVGVALEHVTGRPIHELLHDRLLAPLGMTSSAAAITNEVRADQATGYTTMYDDRPPHRQHPLVEARWIVGNTADGSIVSNVIDMSAYARLLLARCGGFLSEDSFRTLTTPVIGAGLEGFSYALGLYVSDDGRVIRHSGGMPGFTALLVCDLDAGLGCTILVNGSGDRDDLGAFALRSVGAALRGEPLPDVSRPPDPSITADAEAYAGVYRGDGREIQIAAYGDRLVLREEAVEVTLERAEGDLFLVPHPGLDRFHLRFGRDANGRPVEVLHGGDRLLGEGHPDPRTRPAPPEWEAYTGHYRGPGLWEPSFRVVLRAGELLKISSNAETEETELRLVPLTDGSFRVGADEWRPDRLRFDALVEGKAHRALYNGVAWHRTFEP